MTININKTGPINPIHKNIYQFNTEAPESMRKIKTINTYNKGTIEEKNDYLFKQKKDEYVRNYNSFNKNQNNNKSDLDSKIELANKGLEMYSRRLKYSVHEKTNNILVKVIDTSTDEIIKEIPPEKFINMMVKFLEMAGILVDKKV